MATAKVTPGAIQRRKTNVPLAPNASGQMSKPVPKGYYQPTSKDTIYSIAQKYGTTAAALQKLNPGYRMSAGFGANPNQLRVRSYAAPKPAAKVTPKVTAPVSNPIANQAPVDKYKGMSLDEIIGNDTEYQNWLSQAGQNQASFLANIGTQKDTANTDAAEALRKLAIQNPKDREAQLANFAARGLDTSGIYANAQADLSNQYLQNQTDISNLKTKTLADLEDQTQQYNATYTQQKSEAQRAAILRKLLGYDVTEGTK